MNLVEEIAPGTILRHLSGGGTGLPPPSRPAQDYDYPYPPAHQYSSPPPEDYQHYHPSSHDHHREYDRDRGYPGYEDNRNSRGGYDHQEEYAREGYAPPAPPRDWESSSSIGSGTSGSRGYPEQHRNRY
jgi:hypothetical protein